MNRLPTIVGPVLFVAAIAAHWAFGPVATVRVAGAGLALFGVHSLLVREIPVGWEGRPPSFHLRGPLAVLIGVVAMAAGLAMLVFAPAAACVIGWARDCSPGAS